MQSEPTLVNKSPAPATAGTQSICIVICYIGRCPRWINLFFKTCEKNSSIDFLIFTDCIPSDIAPPNVTIIDTTLKALADLASQTVGFEVSLTKPYKLCDFKVAYGEMFEAYLKPYTFWGTTDLDVIFGDISAFVTDEVLVNHDLINGHIDYIVGHFTLYRNMPVLNSMFRQSRDYKRVYQTPECMSFGECGGQWQDFRTRRGTSDEEARMDSTMHVVKRLESQGKIRTYFKTLVREREHLHKTQWLHYWDNGRLFDVYENQEIMYLHFHFFGRRFNIPDWQPPPDKFYINSHGFFV